MAAAADHAESLAPGMRMDEFAGMGGGRHDAVGVVTRSFARPPTVDASNGTEAHLLEPFRGLGQLQQQTTTPHLEQQQTPQALQMPQQHSSADHGPQSKHGMRSGPGPRPPKQQHERSLPPGDGGQDSLGEEGDDDNGSTDGVQELEDLLTKLNPLAKEFVPVTAHDEGVGGGGGSSALSAASSSSSLSAKGGGGGGGGGNARNGGRQKNGYSNGGGSNGGGCGGGGGGGGNARRRKVNSRTSRAQREDSVRRTVYVSDIDQQVTEEQLAALFITCGQVIDCRVCGDPNSVLRFAFVEFTDEDGAYAALSLAGTMLGYYPVRVLPSKTAIVPVNPTFLPRSEDEREMCARTIYCTNIDKKVSQADVKLFFESLCGEVSRLRLLGDHHHSTRIAFVEFTMAESAMAALNCSGAILGSLPIRLSPSKTPVRPRSPRPPLH